MFTWFSSIIWFLQMNLDRHVGSHLKFFQHLIQGDGEDAEKHRKFYDEYLAVMDLVGEFYLQTVEYVFQNMLYQRRNEVEGSKNRQIIRNRCSKITDTALMTVEGNLMIFPHLVKQWRHGLCKNLSPDLNYHHFKRVLAIMVF